MANDEVKISALPDAAVIDGTEEVPIVQAGITKRASVADLQARLNGTLAPLSTYGAVFFGDSITDCGLVGTAPNMRYAERGWWVWMNAMLGWRFEVLNDAGVTSDTLALMLARVTSGVTAFDPGWVFILGGTNDVANGRTLAQCQAGLTAILDALPGRNLVVCTVPPSDAATAPQDLVRDGYNQWIRQLPKTRKALIVVDLHDAVTDPATNNYLTACSYDGVHPASSGAFRMGRAAAEVLNAVTFPRHDLSLGVDNLNLLGAPGSFNGDQGNGLATGWTEYHGSSAVATFSKVARTDWIPGYWQQVTVPSGNHEQQIQCDITTGFSVGDTVFGHVEMESNGDIETPIAAGFPSYSLRLMQLDGSDALVCDQLCLATNGDGQSYLLSAGVLRTPPTVIPATVTKLRLALVCNGGGTYRFARAAIRKVA